MKKIEIFDTISFTPFGTLACPSTPHHPISMYWMISIPPILPLCAFMSSDRKSVV